MNLFEAKQLLKKRGYRLIREAAGNTYVVYEYSGRTPDWARVVTVTSDRDEIADVFYDFITYGPDDITYCGVIKPTSGEVAKFRKLVGKDLEHDPEGTKFLMDTIDKYNYPYEISGDYMYDLGFDLYDDDGEPTMDFDSPEFTKILKDYAEQSADGAIAALLGESIRVKSRRGRKLYEHTINKDEVYGVDVYYNSDFSFPDFDTQEPESTEEYTYDELVSEFGKNAANELITLGSYDTGNNTYYKLAYVIGADGDVTTADKLDF